MSLLDDFRTKGVTFRLTEEMLYAEVYKEVEAGIKRDGLWAKALAESKFDELTAKSFYIKYRVQSLRDEIDIASMEKINNPAPATKKLSPSPVPRVDNKIDKDLTCNSCGYFGKMTWTRGTTISEKVEVFLLGWMLASFLLIGSQFIVSDTITTILILPLAVLPFVIVYFWISKFIVACPKCRNKGQVFSGIK